MSKKRFPHGFIRKDYPLGQFGGCPTGMYGTGSQAGGFAFIPAIAAAYAGLKTVQPFSKAKQALEDNVGEKDKNHMAYKIAHKVSSIGSSLGFGYTGQNTGIAGPITYQKKVYQPILGIGGSKTRKQGTGRKRKRKSRKSKK